MYWVGVIFLVLMIGGLWYIIVKNDGRNSTAIEENPVELPISATEITFLQTCNKCEHNVLD